MLEAVSGRVKCCPNPHLKRFHNLQGEKERERTEQSFFVDKQDIVNNDYDLSINKYKEVVYEQVEYEPTEVIIDKIEKIEAVDSFLVFEDEETVEVYSSFRSNNTSLNNNEFYRILSDTATPDELYLLRHN